MANGLRLRLSALGFVFAFFIAAGPTLTFGVVCPDGTGPFGGCLVNAISYPGENPYAITITDSENQLVACDLYSGLFYKFPIGGGGPTTYVAPFGVATVTGMAYHTTEGVIYWVIDSGGGATLVTSDLFGGSVSVIGLLEVPFAGAFLGDITFNDETGSFWCPDITNDVYFEFDETGQLVTDGGGNPVMFSSPAIPSFGGEVFGTGITQVPSGGIGPFFDIPVGQPIDLRASMVQRVDTDGDPIGLFYDLDSDNELTGWVSGIVYAPEGSNPGIEVEYIIDLSANRIVEVPIQNPNSRSVVDVTLTADDMNTVTVSWTNVQPYATLEIHRDGTLVTTLVGLSPGPDSFDDLALEDGTYSYTLTPTTSGGTVLPTAELSVVVGFGRLLNAVSHNGDSGLGITVVESTNQVYVVDFPTGLTHRYTKDLILVDTIQGPFASDFTTGIAWRDNGGDGTLFWADADNNMLAETDIDGSPLGAPVSLLPPSGGILGDIAWDADTDTFWGVDFQHNEYFNFDATGMILSSFDSPAAGVPTLASGVTVVGGPISFLDIPQGTDSGSFQSQVIRANVDGTPTGILYDLGPSTRAAIVNGAAWTASGSLGSRSEYVVASDTNAVYELSLDVVLGTPFKRGDANGDGLVLLPDATYILNFLFVDGPSPVCLDAADANDDGQVLLPDAPYILNYLFTDGPPPPDPGPNSCGLDPTDDDSLPCDEYDGC